MACGGVFGEASQIIIAFLRGIRYNIAKHGRKWGPDMAELCIKIAGQVAAVKSLFDSSRDYCARYLTEEKADFSVAVSREDLAFEQGALLAEALEEGLRPRTFTDPFLERTAIQRAVAEHLLAHDTLMVHGSLVAVDGEGYLFMAAKCGTGKSTHTRLWREVFGDRAVMVNDDKPFLRITEAGVLACGAPWSGKHGLDANITVPLKGICLLARGVENQICPAQPEALLPMLLKQSYAPLEESRQPRHRALVETLAKSVPLWKMECNKEVSAVQAAYGAMAGHGMGG